MEKSVLAILGLFFIVFIVGEVSGAAFLASNPVDSMVSFPDFEFYNSKRVFLDLQFGEEVNKITYTDFGHIEERVLCRGCNKYQREKSFTEGIHFLHIMAYNSSGLSEQKIIWFFIDSFSPRIYSVEPKMGFASGIFKITFSEETPISLVLNYGNNLVGFRQFSELYDCEPNIKDYVCTGFVNLSDYDGQKIEYWAVIEDIAGNTKESRKTIIQVDTTAPEIKNLETSMVGEYLYLNMTILNENRYSIDKVEYLDNSNSNSRWRTLCPNFDSNNCYNKIRFSAENYNVTIRATDRAGNSDEKTIVSSSEEGVLLFL
jgi:hypothetical protein